MYTITRSHSLELKTNASVIEATKGYTSPKSSSDASGFVVTTIIVRVRQSTSLSSLCAVSLMPLYKYAEPNELQIRRWGWLVWILIHLRQFNLKLKVNSCARDCCVSSESGEVLTYKYVYHYTYRTCVYVQLQLCIVQSFNGWHMIFISWVYRSISLYVFHLILFFFAVQHARISTSKKKEKNLYAHK